MSVNGQKRTWANKQKPRHVAGASSDYSLDAIAIVTSNASLAMMYTGHD